MNLMMIFQSRPENQAMKKHEKANDNQMTKAKPFVLKGLYRFFDTQFQGLLDLSGDSLNPKRD